MSRLPPLPSTRDLLNLYRIRAQKRLSQNFLMDPRLHHKLVRCAGNLKGTQVLEVGPGPGGLTRAILERGAANLVVIEKDKRFLPTLELLSDACGGRLNVVLGDIMTFDLSTLFPSVEPVPWTDYRAPQVRVIANLPFNVATPLIIRWLRDLSLRRGIFTYGRVPLTLTFQKEVAERMVAPESSSQRCRLSIMCQYLCKVEHRITIPGKAFVPKPDVDVGVVNFVPLRQPLIPLPFDVVEKFMRNIFHFRRKYSIRGVEVLFPKRQVHLAQVVYDEAGINPQSRPYNLTLEELGRLACVYYRLCLENAGLQDYDYRGPSALRDDENDDDFDNDCDNDDLMEPDAGEEVLGGTSTVRSEVKQTPNTTLDRM